MIKKILIILCSVVIISTTIYYLVIKNSKKESDRIANSNTSDVKSGTETRILFEFKKFFNNESSFTQLTDYVSPSKKVVVSFGPPSKDEAHKTRNSGLSVFIDKNKVGEVSGQGVSVFGFSSDEKYFVSRSRAVSGCAGNCQNFYLNVINIIDRNIVNINIPPINTYIDKEKFSDTTVYPEKVYWNQNGNLEIIAYTVGLEKDTGKLYIISPKEIWDYDLTSNSYTFVKTLPDDLLN